MSLRYTFLTAIFLLPSITFALPPPRYFPLDPGKHWTYVAEDGLGGERTVFVVGWEDGLTRVLFNQLEVRIKDDQASLDIQLGPDELGSYYRFNQPSFIHRDFFSCDDTVEIVQAGFEDVVTPAGIFEGCLRLEYRGTQCADAGTLVEWWKLEVGRVKWVETSIFGERVWVLKSVESRMSFPFRRGDGNASGDLDLSDAVFVLKRLFTGGAEPTCLDAADTNDDGRVDLSDPIALLGYLYLGTDPPAVPGPKTCGVDPGADTLGICVYEVCGPR